MNLTKTDRLGMIRKRQEYFSAIAEEYASSADFIKAQGMWLAIMGIELIDCGEYLKLHIQTSSTGYEVYYAIAGSDGRLTISDIVTVDGREIFA